MVGTVHRYKILEDPLWGKSIQLIGETIFSSTTTNLSILSIQLHLWFHLPGVMGCFPTVFEPKPVSYGHSVKPPHLKHFSHLFSSVLVCFYLLHAHVIIFPDVHSHVKTKRNFLCFQIVLPNI